MKRWYGNDGFNPASFGAILWKLTHPRYLLDEYKSARSLKHPPIYALLVALDLRPPF